MFAAVIGKRVIALRLQDRVSVDQLAGHFQDIVAEAPGSGVVLVKGLFPVTGPEQRMEAPIGKEARKPKDVGILRLLLAIPRPDEEG